ncbi:MAG: ABC transporter permease [Clostridia bacterium]|nr:ABC transporter permease [Clostridia bacterium]
MLASENEEEQNSYEIVSEDGVYYNLVKLSDDAYALKDSTYVVVADFFGNAIKGVATFRDGFEDLGDEFNAAATAAIKTGSFEFNGKKYDIVKDKNGTKQDYDIYCDTAAEGETKYYFVSTIVTPTFYKTDDFTKYNKDSAFKYTAYAATFTGKTEFTYDNVTFGVKLEDGTPIISRNGEDFAFLAPFTASSSDTATALNIEFQLALEKAVLEMAGNAAAVGTEVSFNALAPKLEEGKPVLDENGNVVLQDTEFVVKREQNDYTVWCISSIYKILIYEAPNSEHILGTDANGMDVLARIMFGGRISLLVGFIVVFIEMLIGVIMGGIAGYFGGWVDNIIMRLVDVFYCIPSMPILIITGALFDELNLDYRERLVWMMAILGFLGWAGVARMVRGQILSLREQEFMVAAEASGLSTSRRIFRHLVPNVMPQLIVQATMGLGSVIITESTLSFLGLGVKHPLATWGNMMNNITQKVEYLTAYAYIWVPIGCLICLAVIAFNFVGDGLRDAFDPKMKR